MDTFFIGIFFLVATAIVTCPLISMPNKTRVTLAISTAFLGVTFLIIGCVGTNESYIQYENLGWHTVIQNPNGDINHKFFVEVEGEEKIWLSENWNVPQVLIYEKSRRPVIGIFPTSISDNDRFTIRKGRDDFIEDRCVNRLEQ